MFEQLINFLNRLPNSHYNCLLISTIMLNNCNNTSAKAISKHKLRGLSYCTFSPPSSVNNTHLFFVHLFTGDRTYSLLWLWQNCNKAVAFQFIDNKMRQQWEGYLFAQVTLPVQISMTGLPNLRRVTCWQHLKICSGWYINWKKWQGQVVDSRCNQQLYSSLWMQSNMDEVVAMNG